MRLAKQAQLSLFIILGVVIVISIVLFFALKGSIEREEIAPGVSLIVEELPSEFLAVRPFIEQCLDQSAIDALRILGERGGYIENSDLSPNRDPTIGDAIRFSRQSDLILPYFYFLSSENDCTGSCEFSGAQLPLRGSNSIETQLEDYIDEHIEACFRDFSSLYDLGYVINAQRAPRSNVVVSANNVVVSLDYPLTISKQGVETELTTFHTTLDLDLQNMYEMANYIVDLEDEYRFLEGAALNLIVAFSEVDSKKLPPMSETQFTSAKRTRWHKNDVKNQVKDLLTSYISLLRVTNTLNYQEINTGDRYVDELYNKGMSIPNNSSINDLEVRFTYLPFWDPYFDLNCNGQICQPESAFIDIIPVGIHRYNFVYDLSFPVLVEITDPAALNDRGYSFSFMLEANIRNNKELPAQFTPYPSIAAQSPQFCDPDKRTSADITINAKDSITDEPLDDVEIIYTCIDSCYIDTITEGSITTKLPIGLGCVLSFSKEDYATTYVEYVADLNVEDTLDIELDPQKEMKINLKKVVLNNVDGDWEVSHTDTLAPQESGVIRLTSEDSFDFVEIINNEPQTITLAPGAYDIEIDIIDAGELYIPKEKRFIGIEEIEIDEINMTDITLGSTTLSYTFTKGDLAIGEITFYGIAIDKDDLTKIEDLDVFSQYADLSDEYASELVPE